MTIDNQAQITRRITATLFATQSMASAAFIANITVGAIIGVELSGQTALAGLPSTLMQAGAAVMAYPAGRFMQRYGRRPGLGIGFLLGLVGLVINGIAVVQGSFGTFLFGLFFLGLARGITDQSRYAAADAVPLSQRARAISTVVFASTVGAVGGPALVDPLGKLALSLGIPELAGPMIGGAVLFAIAGALIMLLLHPDPRSVAIRMAQDTPVGHADHGPGRSMGEVLRTPVARTALTAMVLGQGVMVMVMGVTSVYMRQHGHELGDISLVFAAHTLGMFGLSMVTGTLADRFGRPMMIALGALVLIAGSVLAPVSLLTPWLALALFLVGLGWNFCYIAGSSLLADSLSAGERGRVQGGADLLINLTSAIGSLSSGVILGAASYGVLCAIGVALSLIPLFVAMPQIRAARAAGAA
ncbi:MFS transporter [Oscillochloris sp. ZM17-4]|uniref:MFS transporter n=1 Tax=Oscillochloris sp. ZM17-4 TaxID=2866714 RepID=UPI001C738EC0|nr:MFS transporter [Oscillochloris sp. ZM17-4]MBX0331564.1 MFS transporter [Oscillochloris sp. ZM17-4]